MQCAVFMRANMQQARCAIRKDCERPKHSPTLARSAEADKLVVYVARADVLRKPLNGATETYTSVTFPTKSVFNGNSRASCS
jgi:hypothetical protein